MKTAYTNFTGGEITASLASRYDMAKFKSSCRHLENFIPELHGPLRRRMGTCFLEDLGGPAVLLPFQFSADPTQNYVLVMQEGRIRIAQRAGFILDEAGEPITLEAPYLERQLYDISFAQSGDLVYLAHTGHALRKLQRFAHQDWRLEEVRFTPSIEPPSSVTVAFSSGGSFELRYKIAAVNGKGEISAPANGKQPSGKHPSDWVVGDYATISWPAVEGAESYCVYREEAGIYGLIGVTETTSFRDDRYTADTKDTPRKPENPFSEDNNPGLVAFHQQRLILAGAALQPQTWFGSRTGNYEDFSRSSPLQDDDAFEFTLASGRIDIIQWVTAFGDLLLGTAGSEYKAAGGDGGSISPSSVSVREQSYWGSVRLRPLIIGNSVLHVQRQGSRVRDLFYSLEKDGYAGNDLSVLASHLFDNHLLRQWDYQQAPGSAIFAVRDDGLLLALVYMKEHDIWGWARISTQGSFRSIAVTSGELEDDLFAVVERNVAGEPKWYLERFASRWREEKGIEAAFYIDSGLSYQGEGARVLTGLEHLEGCAVAILADGSPLPHQIVSDGCVTLPFTAKTVHVGLPYRSLACPQTPEADLGAGSSLGRFRGYGQAVLRLLASVGGKYGPDPQTLYDLPFVPAAYGAAVQPFTGDRSFSPSGGYDAEGRLWLAQDLPLPFTIAALTLDVDISG